MRGRTLRFLIACGPVKAILISSALLGCSGATREKLGAREYAREAQWIRMSLQQRA